jgi:hypothetical protein
MVSGSKLLEALLPEEEDDTKDEAADIVEETCTIVDSDTNGFDWKIFYMIAAANLISIHLETLEKRRIALNN